MGNSTPLEEVREHLKDYLLLVVPYSHADWAWTHTRHWHELRYVKVIDEVLDIIKAQEEEGTAPDAPHAFRWYADCYRTEIVPYLEARPERVDELRRRVSEGRVAICGGYVNIRINHAEGETFIRSLIFGRRVFAELFPDADLTVHSDLVDVSVGHPQLPQLLSLADRRYLQFWRSHQALNEKGIPQQFVWEGLDGSRILCSRGCYSGLAGQNYVPEGYRDKWDEMVQFWWENLLQEKHQHSPSQILWLQHASDDSRPLRTSKVTDQPLDLVGSIQEWNQREDSSIRFATPVDAFRELEKLREDLPVVQGTIDPCDVSHKAALLGARGLWRLRSETARGLAAAEILDALRVGLPAGAQSQCGAESERHVGTATFERLWKHLLRCSCHATQWLFQDDFDEQEALAKKTLFETRQAQAQLLKDIAGAIKTGPNSVAVFFNPFPYERTIVAPLRLSFVEMEKGGAPAQFRLRDGSGDEMAYQVIDELAHAGLRWELDTLVQVRLPAGGWNVVSLAEGGPKDGPEEGEAIENDTLQLDFRLGRLMGIVDKAAGIEWAAPEDMPFGHLRAYEVDTNSYLWMGPIIGRYDARWESWEIAERGPVRWALRAEGTMGPHRVAQDVRVYRGEKRVEFHVEIDCAGVDGFIASHLPYPSSGKLAGDMPFCVEDKDLSKEPYVGVERRRPGMFIAQSFVDWAGDDRAMAYVSHDGDRYYLVDESEQALKHILINGFLFARQEKEWARHINRLAECKGRHEFTYSLVPHGGDWRAAQLWRVAESLRTRPLQTWPLSKGELPPYHSLLSVSPDNVTLSAFYRDGERILLRVFENAGQEAEAVVRLPFEPSDACVVDLMGGPSGRCDLRCDGHEVAMSLRPWQMVTIALLGPK